MDKSIRTPHSLEQKKALPKWWQKKEFMYLKLCISICVATVLKCLKLLYPYVHVIGVWWWVFGSRSVFKVTRDIQLGLGLVFLQTSQVLPHWLNHHFSSHFTIHPFIHPSIHLSFYRSIHSSTHHHLSLHACIHPLIYPSIPASIHPSI